MFYIHIPIIYFFVEFLLKALYFEITNPRYGCNASELKTKKKKEIILVRTLTVSQISLKKNCINLQNISNIFIRTSNFVSNNSTTCSNFVHENIISQFEKVK
jgi:hypothetical protein